MPAPNRKGKVSSGRGRGARKPFNAVAAISPGADMVQRPAHSTKSMTPAGRGGSSNRLSIAFSRRFDPVVSKTSDTTPRIRRGPSGTAT